MKSSAERLNVRHEGRAVGKIRCVLAEREQAETCTTSLKLKTVGNGQKKVFGHPPLSALPVI